MELILWRHAEAEDEPASSKQGSRLRDAHVRESGFYAVKCCTLRVDQSWN